MKWKEWLTKLVRSTKKEKRSISEISYEEAQKILKQNKKSILLDVRSKQEYEKEDYQVQSLYLLIHFVKPYKKEN